MHYKPIPLRALLPRIGMSCWTVTCPLVSATLSWSKTAVSEHPSVGACAALRLTDCPKPDHSEAHGIPFAPSRYQLAPRRLGPRSIRFALRQVTSNPEPILSRMLRASGRERVNR